MQDLLQQLPKTKLKPSEEAALIKQHSEESLNKLVEATLREALLYSRRCCSEKIPDDELLSYCYQALKRSAKHFTPGRGRRFFAFAKPAVRGELTRYWKNLNVVRNSQHIPLPEVRSESPEEIINPDFQTLFMREQWEQVHRIIEQVCDEYEQTILQLAYRGRLNFQQIGTLLGVTRSAIQITHARAIQKIRDRASRNRRLLGCEDFSS